MSIDGMTRIESHGTRIYRWKVFEPVEHTFTAAITSRLGGRSTGHLSGLNLGHAVSDSEKILSQNRGIIEKVLGLEGYSWSTAVQVHGCRIAPALPGEAMPHSGTDALAVSRPGVIAAVMLADCHPIVLYDRVRNTALVCHAGWRGTASGMADTAVKRMLETGSRIEDLLAATGPGIGSCCYQVGDDVKTAFEKDFDYPGDVVVPDPDGIPGRWRLDIEAANLARLRRAGIMEDNLGSGGLCTACRRDEFYSYRKEKGLTGRHNALVALSS